MKLSLLFGVWIRSDKRFFGLGCNDLNVDVVLAGKEETLTDWEARKALALLFCELEDVGQNIDGGSGLFEEKLHRGVRDNSTTHLGTHEVLNVLGNCSETEVVFTSALGEAKEEVCRIFILHELPGLINDKHALALVGAGNVPNVVQDDIHCDWAKFIFEIANIEDDHVVVDVDITLLREDAGKSTASVFAETCGEVWTRAAHVEQSIVEIDDSWWRGSMRERIARNTRASVSIDKSLVEVAIFVWRQTATEHDAQEAMQSDKVGAKRIVGVFGINDLW